jgi:hypothetical protein
MKRIFTFSATVLILFLAYFVYSNKVISDLSSNDRKIFIHDTINIRSYDTVTIVVGDTIVVEKPSDTIVDTIVVEKPVYVGSEPVTITLNYTWGTYDSIRSGPFNQLGHAKDYFQYKGKILDPMRFRYEREAFLSDSISRKLGRRVYVYVYDPYNK